MMNVKEEKNVECCSQCPFCESKRIYTADSFETVFELFCKKLNERIYTIDWNEEGKRDTPPEKCPFNKETTDLYELLERFKLEFAKLSMDEQLEFIHTDAFLSAVWKCGCAEAIERHESDK